MGTWTGITSEAIIEASAGDGIASAAVNPEPGEGYCYVIKRTGDFDDSDPWLGQLQVAVDVDNGEWVVVDEQRQASTNTLMVFPFRGPIYAARVWIENDDATPTDVVGADVDYRKDGVTI